MNVKTLLAGIVRKMGYEIISSSKLTIPEHFPPGHFHSVIPSSAEVMERASAIFVKPAGIPCVDLNIEGQIQTLNTFKTMKADPPFYLVEHGRRRFNIEND